MFSTSNARYHANFNNTHIFSNETPCKLYYIFKIVFFIIQRNEIYIALK